MSEPLSDAHGYGVAASRPAAGIVGRYYYATDTTTLYRDNGTTWDTQTSGGSAAGIIAQTLVPSASDVVSTNATYTDITAATISFVVPASGKVVAWLSAEVVVASGYTFFWALRKTSNSSVMGTTILQSGGGGTYPATKPILVTGLTPGATETWKWSQYTDGGGSLTTRIVLGDAMLIVMAAA
jgi:hypothetical protein